jgi:hypothetical protein
MEDVVSFLGYIPPPEIKAILKPLRDIEEELLKGLLKQVVRVLKGEFILLCGGVLMSGLFAEEEDGSPDLHVTRFLLE